MVYYRSSCLFLSTIYNMYIYVCVCVCEFMDRVYKFLKYMVKVQIRDYLVYKLINKFSYVTNHRDLTHKMETDCTLSSYSYIYKLVVQLFTHSIIAAICYHTKNIRVKNFHKYTFCNQLFS